MSEEIVAYVAFEILHILKKCHANCIVHGDVKTANFILRSAEENPFATGSVENLSQGWLKAIDFGCSQFVLGKPLPPRIIPSKTLLVTISRWMSHFVKGRHTSVYGTRSV